MKKNLVRLWPLWLFLAALATALCVFAPALPAMQTLVSPDSGANLGVSSFARRAADWAMGSVPVLSHDELLRILLPPLVFHEFSYAVSVALTALAMGLYLRTLGLPRLACAGGGLALAFAGYNFTLFNAGHRGYFNMMPYAVLLFALVERALRRPSWTGFALMGGCAAVGLAGQPDVMAFFLLLLIAYAAVRCAQLAAAEGARAFFAARWRGLVIGLAVGAVSFAVFGAGTLRHVFGEVLQGRESQIAQTTGAASSVAAEPGGAEESKPATDPEENWIFATNWSLPPEDVAEFFAPCLRGLDSGNAKGPYWGRIGRSVEWTPEAPQGFSNFRQHTIYFGAPVLGIALFALVAAFCGAFGRRKEPGAAPGPAAFDERQRRAAVFFWAGAALVAILLALGRHGFLYRAFYHLPMMDKVRAPLKFVHLAELAVAALFGLGLARLLDRARDAATDAERAFARRETKISMILLIAIAALFAVFGMMFEPKAHLAAWNAMGVPEALRPVLVAGWHSACLRAAWLLALTAAALGLAGFLRSGRQALVAYIAAAAVVVASVVDLALVGARFVQVQDVSPRFAASDLAKDLPAPATGWGYSYLFLMQQPLPNPQLDMIFGGLDLAGVLRADPVLGSSPDDFRLLAFQGFGGAHPLRWAMEGVARVYAAPQLAAQLSQAGIASPVGVYVFGPGGRLMRAPDPRSASVYALRPRLLPPPVAVYHGWRGLPEGADAAAAAAAWTAPGFDPLREVAVAGLETRAPDALPELAAWNEDARPSPLSHPGSHFSLSLTNAAPGLLVVRDNRLRGLFSTLSARVNGTPVPVLRANGGFAVAVEVPAGPSEVVFEAALRRSAFATGLAGAAAFLFLFVLWCRGSAAPDCSEESRS